MQLTAKNSKARIVYMEDVSCSSLACSHARPSEPTTFFVCSVPFFNFMGSSAHRLQLFYPTMDVYFPMILPPGFTKIFFSYLVPKFCFTTMLWSKEGVGFHSPLIGKENEAQRHLLGRDTEGVQRAHWLLVQCSFLMPHCLLSREANCLEPEGTWRDISSISQWGNKDSEKWQHLGDFPRPSLSLPSFHLSHSEASIWAASMYIGCTLQEIWEMVFELRTLTNNPESSGSHITYWEQLKAT